MKDFFEKRFSTRLKKTDKSLLKMGKKLFYSEFFTSENHHENLEANFFKKTSLLLIETVFLAIEEQFFLCAR